MLMRLVTHIKDNLHTLLALVQDTDINVEKTLEILVVQIITKDLKIKPMTVYTLWKRVNFNKHTRY